MPTTNLYEHEKEALLAAIRRDYREETHKIHTDPQWADFHRQNARMDIKLLESLNPKKPSSGTVKPLGKIPVSKSAVTS